MKVGDIVTVRHSKRIAKVTKLYRIDGQECVNVLFPEGDRYSYWTHSVQLLNAAEPIGIQRCRPWK